MSLLLDVAQALRYLHAQGIIHGGTPAVHRQHVESRAGTGHGSSRVCASHPPARWKTCAPRLLLSVSGCWPSRGAVAPTSIARRPDAAQLPAVHPCLSRWRVLSCLPGVTRRGVWCRPDAIQRAAQDGRAARPGHRGGQALGLRAVHAAGSPGHARLQLQVRHALLRGARGGCAAATLVLGKGRSGGWPRPRACLFTWRQTCALGVGCALGRARRMPEAWQRAQGANVRTADALLRLRFASPPCLTPCLAGGVGAPHLSGGRHLCLWRRLMVRRGAALACGWHGRRGGRSPPPDAHAGTAAAAAVEGAAR